MTYDTTTKEGQAKRLAQFNRQRIARHRKLIKVKGDYHWRMVEMLTGDGDYLPSDEGEPPHGLPNNE